MRRGWGLAALILVLAPSRAEAREVESRVVVRFAPQIPAADTTRLASAMRAQLRDTATVTVGDGSASPPAAGTFFVDVDRTEAGMVLRFRDRGTPGTATRIVSREGEIGASEAATIVRAFVVAALERDASKPATDDDRPGSALAAPPSASTPGAMSAPVDAGAPLDAPAATPRAADAPTAAPRAADAPKNLGRSLEAGAAGDELPAAPWRARLAAFYTGATYADEIAWQSGVRLEGAYAFVPGGYAGVGYSFHPSREVVADAATVRVGRQSAAAFGGVEHAWQQLAIAADAGLGLDASSRTTTRTASAVTGTSDATHLSPTFTLRLHGRWRLPEARVLALDVAPGLELAPGERSLVVEGATTTTLLHPALARFRLDVGGTFDAF